MNELKGKFILLLYKLFSEFNPELCEEAITGSGIDIPSLQPEEWYDRKYFEQFYQTLSPDAQTVIGKKIFPTIKATSDTLDPIDNPKDMVKSIQLAYMDNNRGDIGEGFQVLEEDETYLKMKIDSLDTEAFDKGLILGIFNIFKIIRVSLKVEEDIFTIKWE